MSQQASIYSSYEVSAVSNVPEMVRVTVEKRNTKDKQSISGVQALIVSTATRVGMGNLVGVVAAISAGGAGAVFWMWVIALLGSSTAFAEATLARCTSRRIHCTEDTEEDRPIIFMIFSSLKRGKKERNL